MPMREWILIPGSVGTMTVRPMTAGPGGPVDHYILTAPARTFPVKHAWISGDDRLHVWSPVEPPMGRWIEHGALRVNAAMADSLRRWLIGQQRDGGLPT